MLLSDLPTFAALPLHHCLSMTCQNELPAQVKTMAAAAAAQAPPAADAADVKMEFCEAAPAPGPAAGAVKVEPAPADAGHRPAISDGNTEGTLATVSTSSKYDRFLPRSCNTPWPMCCISIASRLNAPSAPCAEVAIAGRNHYAPLGQCEPDRHQARAEGSESWP